MRFDHRFCLDLLAGILLVSSVLLIVLGISNKDTGLIALAVISLLAWTPAASFALWKLDRMNSENNLSHVPVSHDDTEAFII